MTRRRKTDTIETLLALVALTLVAGGCIHTAQPLQPRPIHAQLVATHAVERAVVRLDLSGFDGRAVAVQTSSLSEDEEIYLRAALETRLISLGARLVPRESAERVLHVFGRGLGGVTWTYQIGLPALPIPTVDLLTPEVPIASWLRERGFAQLHGMAYDAHGSAVRPVEPVQERAYRNVYRVLFVSFETDDVYLPGSRVR